MKALIIGIFIVVSSIISASSQTPIQEIDPPGTIQLNNNLYIDKVPVTNSMFLEYLTMKNYLSSQGYDSWKVYYKENQEKEMNSLGFLYPSLLMDLEITNSILSRRGYFRKTQYQHTPVMRITKAQAEDYCQWRTEMVEYAWTYFPKHADQNRFAEKIQYRLPSEEEMETARKQFLEKDHLILMEQKNPLRYKPSTDSNKFTLYTISEFTLSGSLYGENWKDVVPTNFPNDFTGFRCVCEVEL